MERVRVVRRGFQYPVGQSLARVQAAGGMSRLTEVERAAVTLREVGPGDFCDDMPAAAKARYLERGDLELVTVGGQDNE